MRNWKAEWEKYSDVPPHKVIILDGSGHKRNATFMKEGWDSDGMELGKIFICNYESLLMNDLFETMKFWGVEELVVDESHRVKSIEATRTKRLIHLKEAMLKRETTQKHHKTHTTLLTGTPVLNSQMDLFTQFMILDGGATFGRNFPSFRSKYFYDKNAWMPRQTYFPDWQVKPSSTDEIKQLISKKSMSVKKEECLTLPPLVRQEIEVNLSPEQRKSYDEMKKEFITYLNSKACVASMALTQAIRLQQIVSGFLKFDDKATHHFYDIPRNRALSDLLTNLLPNKVIIWAVFHEDYKSLRYIADQLKIKPLEIHGGISNEDKFKNMDLFNSDPQYPILIANPAAGGIGINLVVANYSVWYSRSFSLEQDIQATARNYRGGSEIHRKITRYDLVAKGTIDEIIMNSLLEKKTLADKILDLKGLL